MGRQLAAFREAAGFRQQELANLVCYSRSSIANVEIGRQSAPRTFWQHSDEVLCTGGVLVAGYDALLSLNRHQRETAAHAMMREAMAAEIANRDLAARREVPGVPTRREWLATIGVGFVASGVVGLNSSSSRVVDALTAAGHRSDADEAVPETLTSWSTTIAGSTAAPSRPGCTTNCSPCESTSPTASRLSPARAGVPISSSRLVGSPTCSPWSPATSTTQPRRWSGAPMPSDKAPKPATKI
ncbi:MAG: helix-turn-helix domain-containing protein [Dactylosporangium sp.]|nr:helix-turn-helix domain-containing protein [Dactylosporangium sp.]NNJ60965.1 helix-turn-helix domain-containing protein [Dactylosporangium sp.]